MRFLISALEKAAWLRELMQKADSELRLRKGWALHEPAFETVFEGGDGADGEAVEVGAPVETAADARRAASAERITNGSTGPGQSRASSVVPSSSSIRARCAPSC